MAIVGADPISGRGRIRLVGAGKCQEQCYKVVFLLDLQLYNLHYQMQSKVGFQSVQMLAVFLM